jgi:hypothetical protein
MASKYLNYVTAAGTYSYGFRDIHFQTPSRIWHDDQVIATYVDFYGDAHAHI